MKLKFTCWYWQLLPLEGAFYKGTLMRNNLTVLKSKIELVTLARLNWPSIFCIHTLPQVSAQSWLLHIKLSLSLAKDMAYAISQPHFISSHFLFKVKEKNKKNIYERILKSILTVITPLWPKRRHTLSLFKMGKTLLEYNLAI